AHWRGPGTVYSSRLLERFGKGYNSVLCHRICPLIAAFTHEEARDRCGIFDMSTFAVLAHHRHESSNTVDDAEYVDTDHPVPLVNGDALDTCHASPRQHC